VNNNLVAVGALPPLKSTEQAQVDQVLALMPDCYTQELDDCIHARTSEYPGCAIIQKYYVNVPDASPVAMHVEEYVDEIPFCSKDALIRSPLGYGLIAGAALLGIAVGVLVVKST
jgi:hypothetical protein